MDEPLRETLRKIGIEPGSLDDLDEGPWRELTNVQLANAFAQVMLLGKVVGIDLWFVPPGHT